MRPDRREYILQRTLQKLGELKESLVGQKFSSLPQDGVGVFEKFYPRFFGNQGKRDPRDDVIGLE
ncbi:MAG: hypothetical protein NTY64_23665 [Deltaproteobacteria bacterium]|nr:hypothetical protein [Deltaproteobacteria bacterium]